MRSWDWFRPLGSLYSVHIYVISWMPYFWCEAIYILLKLTIHSNTFWHKQRPCKLVRREKAIHLVDQWEEQERVVFYPQAKWIDHPCEIIVRDESALALFTALLSLASSPLFFSSIIFLSSWPFSLDCVVLCCVVEAEALTDVKAHRGLSCVLLDSVSLSVLWWRSWAFPSGATVARRSEREDASAWDWPAPFVTPNACCGKRPSHRDSVPQNITAVPWWTALMRFIYLQFRFFISIWNIGLMDIKCFSQCTCEVYNFLLWMNKMWKEYGCSGSESLLGNIVFFFLCCPPDFKIKKKCFPQLSSL